MTDYLTFWQLEQPVFLRPLRSEDLFWTPSLQASVARLLLMCRQTQTLSIIVGDSGTGKSTLLKWLYHSLALDTHELMLTALVRQEDTPGWLTPRLAEQMGVAKDLLGGDLPPLMRATAARLDDLVDDKRSLLIAVDSAHLITNAEALSEVSAFLNLQALAGPCLSFLLCGDRRLGTLLAATPELATRTSFALELSHLSQAETTAYIEHRLQLARAHTQFDQPAVALLHEHAQGVLAKINAFAENCLIEAAFQGQRSINASVAQAAAANLGSKSLPQAAQPAPPVQRDNPMAGSLLSTLLRGEAATLPRLGTASAAPKSVGSTPEREHGLDATSSAPSASDKTLVATGAPVATTMVPADAAGKSETSAAEAARSASAIKLSSLFKAGSGRKR